MLMVSILPWLMHGENGFLYNCDFVFHVASLRKEVYKIYSF